MASPNIPRTARAAVITSFKENLVVKDDFPVKQASELKPGECLVKIEYAGCCHSDIHIRDDDWGIGGLVKLPLVGGHEGVGRVVAIGEHTVGSNVKLGDRVGLKWFGNACLKCEMCRTGWETCCDIARASTHGCMVHGTFADYAVAYVDYVTPIPEGLDGAEVTPLLCAGLTIYRAINQANMKPGQWIAITGAGGGLGHLGIQFAVHRGLRVIAIDTGEEKKELCLKLGAEKWIDFRGSENLVQDVIAAADGKGPHAAVIATGNAKPFNDALMYIRTLGTIVAVGMPVASATLNIPIGLLIAKCCKILGSATGTQQDMIEILRLAEAGKIRCQVEVKPLSEVNNAMHEMEKGNIKGRVVLKM
ncbi:mannitol-1-phosphate dehydrogenase [Moniliophthora roreri MCA 2997]|uniref:alcohol dehydrogenase n=2 Tax=Moniliophthora roreri TaxID=221103 RepID=V2YAM1_MONRO|nr:mannitol-1-phosphate dehydrogenase [Moniliophthora roreri MCA 2997]KAI3596553.1 mannitol-1-phosphate dehydrogenase [Moniliophthora roreri]